MKKLVCIVSIVLAVVVMTGVRNSFAERLLSVGIARLSGFEGCGYRKYL